MFLYKYVTVDGVASDEDLETILTSTAEEAFHIDALQFMETTATENHDAVLRSYLERERILDIPLYFSLRAFDSDTRLNGDQWIYIDEALPVGQSLKVGHLSGATLSIMIVAVKYHIV